MTVQASELCVRNGQHCFCLKVDGRAFCCKCHLSLLRWLLRENGEC